MIKKKRTRKRNRFLFFLFILIIAGSGILGSIHHKKIISTATQTTEPPFPTSKPTITPLPEKEAETQNADEIWIEIFENKEAYPEALIEDLERNPEMLDFVAGYLETEPKSYGGITEKESTEKTPLFIQWDKRWGYVPYGSLNIGVTGCGPTCLSMVLYSFTRNKEYTPDMLAQYAMDNGYYVKDVGTDWSFMTEAATEFGLLARQLYTWHEEEIKTLLNEGKLLICTMKPGDFTDTGHFIVIKEYSNGKLLINDPFSYVNSQKEWDYETINSQCKQMWSYEMKI